MSQLHVSCAVDARYLPHCSAMLHSLIVAAGDADEVVVHFLHGPDLLSDALLDLRAMVAELGGSIEFIEIPDAQVVGLRIRDGLPAPHWYRIFLPELLPDLDRVLYLDADLLVLEGLGELWATDLSGSYLAAVTNVFQANHLRRITELGLADPRRYFNSGVLLMNLELMREEGCADQLARYARANAERLAWPDQDALNILCGDRRRDLHPRWNCMNSILLFPHAAEVFGAEAVEEARARPAIRHFEGPSVNKPWHYLCERGMRELYLEHRRHTPWPEVRLEGRTVANRLRRLRSRLSA